MLVRAGHAVPSRVRIPSRRCSARVVSASVGRIFPPPTPRRVVGLPLHRRSHTHAAAAGRCSRLSRLRPRRSTSPSPSPRRHRALLRLCPCPSFPDRRNGRTTFVVVALISSVKRRHRSSPPPGDVLTVAAPSSFFRPSKRRSSSKSSPKFLVSLSKSKC
ncbi:uncharacterized protein LOC121055147 [Oryza brachyantha]|uniref:uncharacterized protein LOC121055147 n=1 Tax=Oryza brachyantha TaxID=4533 RepID=UPI001ADA790E|nr:uncharacterized protein LOC121055147 [Oryza brachyantha]